MQTVQQVLGFPILYRMNQQFEICHHLALGDYLCQQGSVD